MTRNSGFEIDGFRFAAVSAGIKHANSDRLDLALIVCDVPAVSVAVTTTNLVCAAPVTLTRERVKEGASQAILINSGNANAYTGDQGFADSVFLTGSVANILGLDQQLVIPMSTGVIGQRLPIERINQQIPKLVDRLDRKSFRLVASAILTTDTREKIAMAKETLSNGELKILGMAKGAGMIAPNMATMLAVIMVNMRVEKSYLERIFFEVNKSTFNSITIDGDTSTNDTALVLSGGASDAKELPQNETDRQIFSTSLMTVCSDLAKQIVRDGEGATKFVEVKVLGAPDSASAARVCRRIAESPLVKTAFHGEDPNWGRIICAAGSAGVQFDPSKIDLWIGSVQVLKSGVMQAGDLELLAKREMSNPEFSVSLDLKVGSGTASIFTCDLSEEYIGINADYRS
ncbi:MAG: bifunctional glutamate N-acetyltransferase/amino-acid acetyltransferase ArgJ [Desulfomonilaceae bacterium]